MNKVDENSCLVWGKPKILFGMVTIRNKFIVLAAGFWLTGLILVLLGAYGKSAAWEATGLLLSMGVVAQAIGFGFFGYLLMQAAFTKKK